MVYLGVDVVILLVGLSIGVENEFTATGCYPNVLQLDCSQAGDHSIHIGYSVFGVDSCFGNDGTCCPAQTRSTCLTQVQDSEPQYYNTILEECNRQIQCILHINRTTSPGGCPIPNALYTNFMTINYTCTNVITTFALTTQPTTIVETTTAAETTTAEITTTKEITTTTFSATTTGHVTSTNGSHTTITKPTATRTSTDAVTENLYTQSVQTVSTTGDNDARTSATSPNVPYSTADPCPEVLPWYRNWIFIGQAIAIAVLLIIIIILAVFLCCKSAANNPKKANDQVVDDEGGFRRNPSMRNYNRHLQYNAEYIQPPPPGDLQKRPHQQATLDLSNMQNADLDKDSEDSASFPLDSFDNTEASSDSEADLVKTGMGQNTVSKVNSIRVYHQNSSEAANRGGASGSKVPTPPTEVTSTFKAPTGVTLPGFQNRGSTPVFTQNDGVSVSQQARMVRQDVGPAPHRHDTIQSTGLHTSNTSVKESFKFDTSRYELEKHIDEEDDDVFKPNRERPELQPPPPPDCPPPEEESPDDLMHYGSRRLADSKPRTQASPTPEHSPRPTLVLTEPNPAPRYSRQSNQSQPSSPQQALPLLRIGSSIRNPSPFDTRAQASSSVQAVVPYATRALVKPIPHRVSHSTTSPPHETPIYSQVFKPMSPNGPRPMHQPRTQLHVLPPQHPTKPTHQQSNWLRFDDSTNIGHSNEGFYV